MSDVDSPWGRVDEEGTVYVRTKDGERAVGQWPGGDPAQALGLFRQRYAGLAAEVALLEARVRDARLGAGEAAQVQRRLRASVTTAAAVGDLDALLDRLDRLDDVIGRQRELRTAERARTQAQARARKEQISAEAEKIAEGSDWRAGADRLGRLLEEWKALPRLDRGADDEVWRRFSAARTTYSRRRKQHYAERGEQQRRSGELKAALAEEAESICESTDWVVTAARYRDLMQRWKRAGPAAKPVEDDLWQRFHAAQDRFFRARDQASAGEAQQRSANAARKEALLAQVEALLPVEDLRRARGEFGRLSAEWDQVGTVPPAQGKQLDARLRRVEQSLRSVSEDRWRRSNPEARARAQAAVTQLEALICRLEADIAAAQQAGDHGAAQAAEEALAARRAWLHEAERAREEFTPDG
jgi:hypothetical protein